MKYEVCKITFGAEPRDCEIYDFVLKNWNRLKFSPSIETIYFDEKHTNPKRMQRTLKKQLQKTDIGTKAHQALKLQREQCRVERKSYCRKQREAEKKRQFALKQKKHKEKHRGR
ncbi:YjdF family protein [Clostridium sp. JNZ X4-2]